MPDTSNATPASAPTPSTGAMRRSRVPHDEPLVSTSTHANGTRNTLSLAETASSTDTTASASRPTSDAKRIASRVNVSASSSPIDVTASSAGKCSRESANPAEPRNAATSLAPARRSRRCSSTAFTTCSARLITWYGYGSCPHMGTTTRNHAQPESQRQSVTGHGRSPSACWNRIRSSSANDSCSTLRCTRHVTATSTSTTSHGAGAKAAPVGVGVLRDLGAFAMTREYATAH